MARWACVGPLFVGCPLDCKQPPFFIFLVELIAVKQGRRPVFGVGAAIKLKRYRATSKSCCFVPFFQAVSFLVLSDAKISSPYFPSSIFHDLMTKLKNELGSALYPVSCLLRSEGPAEAGRAYVR